MYSAVCISIFYIGTAVKYITVYYRIVRRLFCRRKRPADFVCERLHRYIQLIAVYHYTCRQRCRKNNLYIVTLVYKCSAFSYGIVRLVSDNAIFVNVLDILAEKIQCPRSVVFFKYDLAQRLLLTVEPRHIAVFDCCFRVDHIGQILLCQLGPDNFTYRFLLRLRI